LSTIKEKNIIKRKKITTNNGQLDYLNWSWWILGVNNIIKKLSIQKYSSYMKKKSLKVKKLSLNVEFISFKIKKCIKWKVKNGWSIL